MTDVTSSRPAAAWQPPTELTVGLPSGPVVSVYLDTVGAVEDAANRTRLSWKNLRRQLGEDGAPEAALTAVDACLPGVSGAAGTLAAFATAEGLLGVQQLPESTTASSAAVGPLPDLIPLLTVRQREVPLVVVATDRLGADLLAVLPDTTDVEQSVRGEELHVTRSAPGGWSQRRFQQRAENRWDANSREVAEALTRLVETTSARLVVATGDVRAMQFLRAQLPPRVAALVVEVQGDYSSVDNAAEQAREVAAAVAAQETETVLENYARELEQGGNACIGAESTLALAAGQAEEVLLDPSRSAGGVAWFATEPVMVAGDNATVTTAGASDSQRAPLENVLVWGAAASGAAVRVAPAGAPQLDSSGVGALLRYPS